MIRIMHIVELPGSNAWLNAVADHYDRARFAHLVCSLGERNGLHEALEIPSRAIRTFNLGLAQRRYTALAAWKLAALLRREQIDIVQTHLVIPTTVGLLAARMARVPLSILTRHHADFTTIFDKPIHRQIDRLHAFAADRLWSPSQYIKQCMVRYEKVPAERIAVLPHGFDFTLMQPRLDAARTKALREELGGDVKLIVATIARLSVEKGHEFLLRALPAILRVHPQARFVFAGAGPRREELEAMARELGVADYVRFLGWRTDAWDIIEAADAIAHPSLSEPFGIVFVEAMALQKCVVTTSNSAAPEIIDHGETGLIVPPRDPDAFAAAMLSLLADRERMRVMGELARRRAIEKFDFKKMIRVYEAAWQGWLAEGRR
jgi:glycosyltransferase involved in cell wall biosynthesis